MMMLFMNKTVVSLIVCLKTVLNESSISVICSFFAVNDIHIQSNIDQSAQYQNPSSLCTPELNECSCYEGCTW